MSTKIFCDRCGKEGAENFRRIKTLFGYDIIPDLCDSCETWASEEIESYFSQIKVIESDFISEISSGKFETEGTFRIGSAHHLLSEARGALASIRDKLIIWRRGHETEYLRAVKEMAQDGLERSDLWKVLEKKKAEKPDKSEVV